MRFRHAAPTIHGDQRVPDPRAHHFFGRSRASGQCRARQTSLQLAIPVFQSYPRAMPPGSRPSKRARQPRIACAPTSCFPGKLGNASAIGFARHGDHAPVGASAPSWWPFLSCVAPSFRKSVAKRGGQVGPAAGNDRLDFPSEKMLAGSADGHSSFILPEAARTKYHRLPDQETCAQPLPT